MEEDHIRLREKSIEIYVLSKLFSAVCRVPVKGQHFHADGVQNTGRGLADPAQADDSGSLAVKLDHGVVPIAEIHSVLPFSCLDSL